MLFFLVCLFNNYRQSSPDLFTNIWFRARQNQKCVLLLCSCEELKRYRAIKLIMMICTRFVSRYHNMQSWFDITRENISQFVTFTFTMVLSLYYIQVEPVKKNLNFSSQRDMSIYILLFVKRIESAFIQLMSHRKVQLYYKNRKVYILILLQIWLNIFTQSVSDNSAEKLR